MVLEILLALALFFFGIPLVLRLLVASWNFAWEIIVDWWPKAGANDLRSTTADEKQEPWRKSLFRWLVYMLLGIVAQAIGVFFLIGFQDLKIPDSIRVLLFLLSYVGFFVCLWLLRRRNF